MQVWRNCQVLSEQTNDRSAFLNATCLFKYVLKCEEHFSFFIFQSSLTNIWINCNGISKDLLYIWTLTHPNNFDSEDGGNMYFNLKKQ
jgi:hypothetical protein